MSLIVDIKKLQKNIDAVAILKLINTQINAGDVIALLGKNGAGKTTLLETILGFSMPSMGNVNLWGVAAPQIDVAIKQKIGFVPQQNELIGSLTGNDHLELFKAHRSQWNQSLVDKLIIEWLIPVEMRVSKMSLGQQQKLSILLAMAHEPDLLVLDEPVASLDPIARRQFLQQLVDIAADSQRAVVFSTHIVSDVERVANRVWMLRNGELIFDGELDSLKESITRLHFVSGQPIDKHYKFEGAISQRIHANTAVATFSYLTIEQKEKFQQELSAEVTAEYLSLEDIFLEMNDAS